jgi:hypothetical protein
MPDVMIAHTVTPPASLLRSFRLLPHRMLHHLLLLPPLVAATASRAAAAAATIALTRLLALFVSREQETEVDPAVLTAMRNARAEAVPLLTQLRYRLDTVMDACGESSCTSFWCMTAKHAWIR